MNAQPGGYPKSETDTQDFTLAELSNTIQEKSLAFAGYLKKNIFKSYQSTKDLIQKQFDSTGNNYSVNGGHS